MTDLQKKISIMTRGYDDISITENIRCKNCVYCVVKRGDASTCRRLPPCFQNYVWGSQKCWPKVDKDSDWCGEFVSRTEKEGE